MNKYPDFWNVVIGPGPIGAYLGFVFIAYVAATISLLLEANGRDVKSPKTPTDWSSKFLWLSNYKRILANFLAVPLLIRMAYPNLGIEAMLLTAIGTGVIIDRAALYLKNIGVLSSNKTAEKFMQKIADDPKP